MFILIDLLYLTDVRLPNSMPTDDGLNISFNVFFSYKKKVKEPFLFLRIDKHLAILGKVDKQFTVIFLFNLKMLISK